MGNNQAAAFERPRDESGVRSLAGLAGLEVEGDASSALDRLTSPELVGLLLEWISGAVFVTDAENAVAMNAAACSLQRMGLDVATLVAGGAEVVETSTGVVRIVRRPMTSVTNARCQLVLLAHAQPALGGKEIVRLAAARWRPTARQAEILEHILEGLANKEIAAELGISVRTVEVHITALFEKAGVDTRTRLIAKARELAEQAAVDPSSR